MTFPQRSHKADCSLKLNISVKLNQCTSCLKIPPRSGARVSGRQTGRLGSMTGVSFFVIGYSLEFGALLRLDIFGSSYVSFRFMVPFQLYLLGMEHDSVSALHHQNIKTSKHQNTQHSSKACCENFLYPVITVVSSWLSTQTEQKLTVPCTLQNLCRGQNWERG